MDRAAASPSRSTAVFRHCPPERSAKKAPCAINTAPESTHRRTPSTGCRSRWPTTRLGAMIRRPCAAVDRSCVHASRLVRPIQATVRLDHFSRHAVHPIAPRGRSNAPDGQAARKRERAMRPGGRSDEDDRSGHRSRVSHQQFARPAHRSSTSAHVAERAR